MDEKVEGIRLVPKDTAKYLNDKQTGHYANWRKRFLRWLLYEGKNPDKAKGYSRDTVQKTAYRADAFMRFVWERDDGYTLQVEPQDAEEFIEEELIYCEEEYSNGHKDNTQKSIQRLFKWLDFTGEGEEWEPTRSFSTNSTSTSPKEYLTKEERAAIREAALEYGSIPKYKYVTPEERDKWKAHLAQRFGKSKDEVTPDDWERANGHKFVSMVWASLDAGLRPIEVERAKVSWVDISNERLVIPEEDSAKNENTWRVPLRSDTTEMLANWLKEREVYEKYDDTDRLWLTRESNPYQSQSLRRLLQNLCDIAGIDTEHRKMSWYAIRHSVGTYMTEQKDLKAAQSQLRHQSQYTTMQYDQSPEDVRRDGLNKMG